MFVLLTWTLLVHSSVWSHPHHPGHEPAAATGFVPQKLEPGKAVSGWTRRTPVPLDEGILNESPGAVVLPDGRVGVAWVQFDQEGHREKLLLRWESAVGTFAEAQTLFEGSRAWHPRLAQGSEGRVWAVWCGTDQFPQRGDHRRSIFLRRVLPELGTIEKVTLAPGRQCDPVISARSDGSFAVAWESSDLRQVESRIAWRVFRADGKPMGPEVFGKKRFLDRRPALLALSDGWLLAWDRWMDRSPQAAEDPDYDVYGVVLDAKGRPGKESGLVGGPGIQAAPSLALLEDRQAALAFHSSEKHSLVKHAQIAWVRVEAKEVRVLFAQGLNHPWADTESRGEQQGSEFPDLVYHPKKGLLWTSRPSQGFFLHRLEGNEVRTWDLTTGTWSARGLQASIAMNSEGELIIARRGARQVLLERIVVPDLAASKQFRGSSLFKESQDRKATGALREAIKQPVRHSAKPPNVPGATDLKVYLGDVHMHSAISDGAGTPDEVIARAFVRGLDFATLTDHDTVGGSRMLPSEYAEIAWLTDLFDLIPGFTAIHAYEWTTKLLPEGSGHRNVYFQGYGPTEVYTTGSGHGDTQKLWGALRTEKAFAVPHHTTWTGTDWQNHDEAIQRHVEVASVHGVADEPAGPIPSRGSMEGMYAVDGIKKGLRFGFVAGTDGHGLIYHHGIARHRDPWAHAVTGVLAKQEGRQPLWQALYDRHTFGTSGPRSMVFLRAGKDARQGDRVQGPAPWALEYEARMTSPIVEAVLFRNGEKWKQLDFLQGAKQLVGQIAVEPESAATTETNIFFRVVEKTPEGRLEAAWTSPLFFSVGAK
jgi:hypothetical protein